MTTFDVSPRPRRAASAAEQSPTARIADLRNSASIDSMADQTPTQQPLDEQLEEIGAQLDWVRDYL